MADREVRRAAGELPPRGFATRAIHAAHRLPVVDRTPTSGQVLAAARAATGPAREASIGGHSGPAPEPAPGATAEPTPV